MPDIKHTIVYVEWNDSAMDHGWKSSDGLKELAGMAHCCSVGFFVAEDKMQLRLALNAGRNDQINPFGDIISIPKSCITKRVKIKTV